MDHSRLQCVTGSGGDFAPPRVSYTREASIVILHVSSSVIRKAIEYDRPRRISRKPLKKKEFDSAYSG